MNWTFEIPTTVVFGTGSLGRLAELTKPWAGPGVVALDPALKSSSAVLSALAGLGSPAVFSAITPNPTVESVDALAKLVREQKATYVVAIGGGSAIDCAKAAAALAPSDQPGIRPFHAGAVKFSVPGVPLIAVPTTAGTGAEVTPIAVLDDAEAGRKAPIADRRLYPAVALIDPQLTYSLPTAVSASSGLDALAHAVEGYWSKNHQPICDTLAIEAARLVVANLGVVLANPSDATAREAMSYAALLAGMAFQLPKNAMVHACSYPLSQRYHVAHGAACALTLPEAIRLNAPAMGDRMDRFVAGAGCTSAEDLACTIERLRATGGLPRTLSEAGVGESEIDELVAASFHPLMNNNPVTVTPAILGALYRRIYR